MEAARIFGDEDSAQEWVISKRWPRGIRCPSCGSEVSELKRRGTLRRWRCKRRSKADNCGKNFTVMTDTIMHDSKLSVSEWCIAIYLYTTNLKGISAEQYDKWMLYAALLDALAMLVIAAVPIVEVEKVMGELRRDNETLAEENRQLNKKLQ